MGAKSGDGPWGGGEGEMEMEMQEFVILFFTVSLPSNLFLPLPPTSSFL